MAEYLTNSSKREVGALLNVSTFKTTKECPCDVYSDSIP